MHAIRVVSILSTNSPVRNYLLEFTSEPIYILERHALPQLYRMRVPLRHVEYSATTNHVFNAPVGASLRPLLYAIGRVEDWLRKQST